MKKRDRGRYGPPYVLHYGLRRPPWSVYETYKTFRKAHDRLAEVAADARVSEPLIGVTWHPPTNRRLKTGRTTVPVSTDEDPSLETALPDHDVAATPAVAWWESDGLCRDLHGITIQCSRREISASDACELIRAFLHAYAWASEHDAATE